MANDTAEQLVAMGAEPPRPSLFSRILHNWFTRFIIMFMAVSVVYGTAQAIPFIIYGAKPPPALLPAFERTQLLAALIALPCVLLLYTGLVRWLEHRWPSEIALRPAIGQIILGSIVGALLLSAVILVLVASGHGVVAIPPTIIVPVAGLALSIISGVAEELMFRAVMFRLVEERFGTLIGLIVSAAFFGAIHAGNHGATIVSSVAIALEAGFLLGLSYTVTRTLWIAAGLHFAWNFAEGGIFGAPVSGNVVPGILKTTLTGPDIITGGSFGPEASVIAVGVCLVGALLFLIVTLRRGNWQPFTLRKPSLKS